MSEQYNLFVERDAAGVPIRLYAARQVITPLTPARARRTDPLPSHEAADDVNCGTAQRHEDLILAYLRAGDIPKTACEIGEGIGLTNVQVSRRLGTGHPDEDGNPSLEGRGLVQRCVLRKCRCRTHRDEGRRFTSWSYLTTETA